MLWTALVGVSCSEVKTAGHAPKDKQEPERDDQTPDQSKADRSEAPRKDPPPGGSPVGSEAMPPEEPKVEDKALLALHDEEALHDLKSGEEQTKIVCDRNASKTNVVIDAFCVKKLRPKSLVELQTALGLNITNPNLTQRNQNGTGGNPAFAVQGHSSSLVGRFVSAINPRVILMSPQPLANNTPNPRYVVIGFVRGEQFVEIIANNPETSTPDVFLVGFKQACNAQPGGCKVGELLTPAIESNWTEFTLYQDEDLKNTIVDCRHCHQPNGPTGPKVLRMQELRNPWTHWFRDNTAGNTLIADFYAAHGQDETYGGIPGPMIRGSDPQKLENLVRGNGFQAAQVNEFTTARIEDEVQESSPNQPADNTVPGTSATWQALFNRVAAGEVIPVPYHDVKVTEPALLAKFTKQYQDFKAGIIQAADLQDHRDVLRTDQKQLGNMGFAIAPEITDPKQMLNLACAQCHNAKLDQSLSRAKFDVDFTRMAQPAAELDVAIQRVKLGLSPARLKAEGIQFRDKDRKEVELPRGAHLLTMPPRRFKSLTDTQIDLLVKYFEEQKTKLQPKP